MATGKSLTGTGALVCQSATVSGWRFAWPAVSSGRMLTVAAEARTLTVQAEARTLTVQAETRTLTVGST